MPAANSQLDQINHIVVLMLENRSFDNVLGWLYDPENKPPFDRVPRGQEFAGLSGGNYYNLKSDGTKVPAGKGNSMIDPFPDPNEPYVNVYAQMYNELFPPDKVPNTKVTPPMSGFVIDYARAIQSAAGGNKGCTALLAKLFHWGSSPMAYDPGIIMNCFTPERLPVINGLARAYAVCDHWFSSVPTQTFPNRSFIHAATSSGYVTNGWKTGPHEWDIGYLLNKTDTIYNLLSRKGVDWRIFYGGPFLLCNALLCQEKLWEFVPFGEHFFPFAQFLEDAKKPNGLPSYTFIEPNMFCSSKYGPENDMHPAWAITDTGLATNVLYGEELILTIYRALRESPDWNSTLFIITFDEHGGCYDHVPTPPPHAVAPDDLKVPPGHPGYSGFDFKRYGVRVPAVLVSPWIEEGTVCNTVFDHTSVIKTASNRWLDGENLTARDLHDTDVSEVLTRSTPRDDDPSIQPNPVPLFTSCGGQPLSDLHRHMLAAAAKFVAQRTGRQIGPDVLKATAQVAAGVDALKTTDQVVNELDKYEALVKAR